ncbi:hypothetical protein NBO_554g0005 [Nosema bombycis CQ1]|uniref:Uncharacterized protein n=1 Tax=Nosema bombycis (strain CQ1 / CVCC 102059) TaxID=578461 RepID=R0MH18_NOSB1|nr:hypothetical protein NBO_554g0005 [Nosema bombycis CQ1]|eukprot:EOB12088.1 hypothetical protein NBO_554g0005 [Nosema bombycis CQ1]
MPIVDLLFSFSKKNNQVLCAFMDAWKNIRDNKDIPCNLERMYECIAYEHSKQITFNCTEYFIEKELLSSILKLSKMGYKQDVFNFLIKLISELDKNNLILLQSSINLIFTEFLPEHLGICLSYSERIVVYNLEIDENLVDYILKFVFTGEVEGEYARACLIYLLSCDKISSILEDKRFVYKVIESLNLLYKDIYSNIELYKVILELLCLYMAKYDSNMLNVNYDVVDQPTIYYKESNITRDLSLYNLKIPENLDNDKNIIFKTLDVSYKDTVIYKQILKSCVLEEVNVLIINEFIKNMENNDEHIEFIRYLIEKHSGCVSSYFFTFKFNEWDVYEVYEKILTNIKDIKPVKFKIKNRNKHSEYSMIDKIINSKIKDDDIYLFMFSVSKESFYSRFNEIYELMKESKTFFGTLYRMIVT